MKEIEKELNDFSSIQEELTNEIIKKSNDSIDDKLKDCLIAWNVNVIDYKEIKERCTLIQREVDDLGTLDTKKEVWIDGHLVMIFTLPKLKSNLYDNKDVKTSMKIEFECSEIFTPEYYKL